VGNVSRQGYLNAVFIQVWQ